MRKRIFNGLKVFALVALAGHGITAYAEPMAQGTPVIQGYRVVRVYPHDPAAYTQGLIFRNGFLFESTGLKGQSTLRKVHLETGRVARLHRLDGKFFAEGLTEFNGRLVQLTWQSNIAFIYDLKTFAPKGTFEFPGEGWGLTHNRHDLILSDGSDTLRFLDPNTFSERRRVRVLDGGIPIRDLNELEYISGEIYANVWHTDRIAKISPETGKILGWIDLKGLMPEGRSLDPDAVLNGIAYDAVNHRVFVTGKRWPKLFEIQITP